MTEPLDDGNEGELGWWVRCRFKAGKVWAEADEKGRPIERVGKVIFAYKKGYKRTYSTSADRLSVIEGGQHEQGAEAVAPSANPGGGAASRRPTKSTAGKAGAGKGKGKDEEFFGGTSAEASDPQAIHLWSDGACSGNPGPAGAGTVLLYGDHRREISTFLGEGTNNVAELWAVLQGLEALRQPVSRTLAVHTDSKYVIGVLARGWKGKANADLIARIRGRLAGLPRVIWHWVRGHEGVELNERCDLLARQAIESRSSKSEVVS